MGLLQQIYHISILIKVFQKTLKLYVKFNLGPYVECNLE
jgi:hypothetical protein